MKAVVLVALSLVLLGAASLLIFRLSVSPYQAALGGTDTSNEYTINERMSDASSGGGTSQSTTRVMQPAELAGLIEQLKTLHPIGSFKSSDRTCYFTNAQTDYLVCFAGGRIVNFLTTDGPHRDSWSAEGYAFDFGRSVIISSIGDLKACSKDYDCTLTSSGVCDPSGRCPEASSQCDPGCRTSINVKYDFVWGLDYLPDSCITDKCASLGKEYFTASCKDGTCESVIAPVS